MISAIVTRGFGFSVALIVTAGFGSAVVEIPVVPVVPVSPPATGGGGGTYFTYPEYGVVIDGSQKRAAAAKKKKKAWKLLTARDLAKAVDADRLDEREPIFRIDLYYVPDFVRTPYEVGEPIPLAIQEPPPPVAPIRRMPAPSEPEADEEELILLLMA